MPGRRILYLSRWYPFPPDNGSRLRTWLHLRALAEEFSITLASFVEPGQEHGKPGSEDFCERVLTTPRSPFRPRSWRARAGYFSGRPRSLVDTFSPAMSALIEGEVRRASFDAAVVSTLDMTAYTASLGSLPAVLDDLELGALRGAMLGPSAVRRARARLGWGKLVRYLRRVLPRFSACSVVSELERELATACVPDYACFHIIENGVDTRPGAAIRPPRGPHHLVFNGSLTYAPNRDAMEWFCARILPRIRKEVPQVELTITGALPAEVFHAPPGVHLIGWQKDIQSVVASATVCVAPIRAGGGTRLKLLEAMALGTPVVTTSKCAEGLATIHGEHLLLAEEEETFAAQVVRLLRDSQLRQRLATAARALVEQRYDADAIGIRFRHLVDAAARRTA